MRTVHIAVHQPIAPGSELYYINPKRTLDLKWHEWKKTYGKCGKVGVDPIFIFIFSSQGLSENLGLNVNVCVFLQTFSNTSYKTNESIKNMASGNAVMGSNVSSRAASAFSPPIQGVLSLPSFFECLHGRLLQPNHHNPPPPT